MQSKYTYSTYLSLFPSFFLVILMENRFKLRISRMFRGSFGSCRPRSMSDVIMSDVMEKPVFVAHNHHRNFLMSEPPLSPKPRPFPSMCRPRCPERCQMIEHSCIVAEKVLPRRKISERYLVFGCGDACEGRKCPPASPASPLDAFYNVRKFGRKKKGSKNKKKRKTACRDNSNMFSSSSADTNGGFAGAGGGYGGWFSSEEDREDETETLFSSRSLSSYSSESSQKRRTRRRNQRNRRRGRKGGSTKDSYNHEKTNVLPLEGKVKDSFAVVKKSSDPYTDFRTSMVEMIVEKQIFAAKDLENLLQCFLSLNSSHHHRIIIEVFTEIWEALFSDCS